MGVTSKNSSMDGTSFCVGISSQPPFFSKDKIFYKNKKVFVPSAVVMLTSKYPIQKESGINQAGGNWMDGRV